MVLLSKPSIGEASKRSSAFPCGMPSTWGMSTRTISPSSLEAAQCAAVAPTLPAPTMLIFARRMFVPFEVLFRVRFVGAADYGERGGGFNRELSEALVTGWVWDRLDRRVTKIASVSGQRADSA